MIALLLHCQQRSHSKNFTIRNEYASFSFKSTMSISQPPFSNQCCQKSKGFEAWFNLMLLLSLSIAYMIIHLELHVASYLYNLRIINELLGAIVISCLQTGNDVYFHRNHQVERQAGSKFCCYSDEYAPCVSADRCDSLRIMLCVWLLLHVLLYI